MRAFLHFVSPALLNEVLVLTSFAQTSWQVNDAIIPISGASRGAKSAFQLGGLGVLAVYSGLTNS
jgi:hypothetical protein